MRHRPDANTQPWETTFGENLQRLRTGAGLSQMDLADALEPQGFNQPKIARIERSAGGLRLNDARILAGYFGASIDAMIDSGASSGEEITRREQVLRSAAKSAQDYVALVDASYPHLKSARKTASAQLSWFERAVANSDGEREKQLMYAASALEHMLGRMTDYASLHTSKLHDSIHECATASDSVAVWFRVD